MFLGFARAGSAEDCTGCSDYEMELAQNDHISTMNVFYAVS
jgi:hypothetical protein